MRITLWRHFFLYSMGLLGIIYGISQKLHAALLLRNPPTGYYEWATPFFFPSKPQQLIFFLAAGISLFLLYALGCALIRKKNACLPANFDSAHVRSKEFIIFYIGIPVSVNAIVVAFFPSAARPSVPWSSYALIALWLSGLLLPFYLPFEQLDEKVPQYKETLRRVQQKFWIILSKMNERAQGQVYWYAAASLLVVICVQLLTIFLPYMRGELFMMNEYMDISEYTRLGGRDVSNTEFINGHKLGGLIKYDPEVDHGNSPLPPAGTFLEVPKTELLELFIGANKKKYYYDDARHLLVIHGPMTSEEHAWLNAILRTEHKVGLSSLYDESRELYGQLKNRMYTSEELDFLDKNRLEMHWQILNRWVIHHHNFVLGPINEYALGKPLKDINVQYGAINVVIMKYLLEATGGISYQNYFQKWYTFWPLYYVLFVALAFLLFRDVYYVALICLLAFGFVNKLDFQHLFLGPGLNPIRHFFDIPAIACLYLYLKNGKTRFLIVGSLLGIVSVVNNQQFGLFLVGSFFVTMVVKALLDRDLVSLHAIIWGSLALVGSGVIVYVGNLGKSDMSPYYLEGFLGYIVAPNKLILIMLLISVCYFVLLRWENATSELKYTALFLLLYSQGLLVYSVWGGTDNHLLNMASILTLGGITFLKLVVDHSWMKHFERSLVGSLLVVALSVVYIPGLLSYYSTQQEYVSNFLNHKTYDWNLEPAKFRSTMNPTYFVDSISLIQAYAPSDNAIHIISKYDNILPFLAGKYSAMPFFDLQWFLLTPKEVQLSVERIKTQSPQFLFVDTGIERSLNNEILVGDLRHTSGDEEQSWMRVQRLSLLKDIFAEVKQDYEPIKQGMLLTVYKRKHMVEGHAVTGAALVK